MKPPLVVHTQEPASVTAACDGVGSRLVIVGCSRRKSSSNVPVPALQLYQGGCIPQLRRRLADFPQHLDRVRILSARHGLIHAGHMLLPYEQPLTALQAAIVELTIRRQLSQELTHAVPDEVLVVAEPAYLRLLGDLALTRPRPRLVWVPQPRAWQATAQVLDAWGWP